MAARFGVSLANDLLKPSGQRPTAAPVKQEALPVRPIVDNKPVKRPGATDQMEQILLEMGVKPMHVQIALRRAQETREPLAQIMRDFGFLSGEQVAIAVSRNLGLEYFPFEKIDQISKAELTGLTMGAFQRFVPVGRDAASDRLLIAVPDMDCTNSAQNTFLNEKVRFVVASEHTIQTVYRKYFANTEAAFDEAVKKFMDQLNSSRRIDEEDESSSKTMRAVFFALIRHACYSGASDLYLYRSDYVGVIKLKINGIGTVFRTVHLELFTRLLTKLVTDNSTKAEDLRKRPKESVLEFSPEDQHDNPDIVNRFGFRLELTESRGIRNAVIRVLDKNSAATDLDRLGFDPETLSAIQRVSRTSVGFFLVTGPTGSGKTTSLYAILKSIDPVERSIQSIENPIEYKHGLWQQYELRKDATDEGAEYNEWLKALLRNAPDVILVGEVRDKDVANICLNAANTGHLVFATLHTNNAVLSLARLKSLEVDQDVLGSVLLGILAQRLIRTVCQDCCKPDDSAHTEELMKKPFLAGTKYRPVKAGDGCPNCDYTGYRGRRMIYELLEMTPEVRRAIETNEPPSVIASKGMSRDRTMYANALRLVAQGITTTAELERVASEDQ